ncbi:uncharacterized protein TNCV_3075671 [Trichonephila clavipes]|nr:uncharacterized protein TNCV_3075671 [Trichonephila clavipes]
MAVQPLVLIGCCGPIVTLCSKFGICRISPGPKSDPAPVNRLVVPLFGVPERHCYRVSAADKGCRVYPLDPRPDAVALYSGCTQGKRCAWFLPDDRHTASLVGLRGEWRHARMKVFTRTYGSEYAVPV